MRLSGIANNAAYTGMAKSKRDGENVQQEEERVLSDLRDYLIDVITLIDSRISELSAQQSGAEAPDLQARPHGKQLIVCPHLRE